MDDEDSEELEQLTEQEEMLDCSTDEEQGEGLENGGGEKSDDSEDETGGVGREEPSDKDDD